MTSTPLPDEIRAIIDRHKGTTAPSASAAAEPPTEVHTPPADELFRFTSGLDWINAETDEIPALWGEDSEVLWADGEGLLVAAAQGVGKTTLAGNIVAGMLTGTPVLGRPIRPAQRVLYLAMDRPRQARRALRRQLASIAPDALQDRLIVWEGPPPSDLARNPSLLNLMAEDAGADVVVVDSLKDAALKLSDDEVGAGWNRAAQTLIAAGRNLLVLHHLRKDPGDKPSLDSIYGSTWLTSGMGSVVVLTGEAGGPFVKLHHVKQPGDPVGPLDIEVDNSTGTMTPAEVDPVRLAHQKGGITAKGLAQAVYGNTKRNDIARARRRLDGLVAKGLLRPEGGGNGPGNATVYVPAEALL